MRLVAIICTSLLVGCTTLVEPDCAVGEVNSNASPVMGASFTGQHIVATLGKTDVHVKVCAEVLKGAMELKKEGKL